MTRDDMVALRAERDAMERRARAFEAGSRDLQAQRDKLRAEIERKDTALRDLIEYAESGEELIDSEWGSCRDIVVIERDGDLHEAIIRARAALAPVSS